jgi:hypothetical protein
MSVCAHPGCLNLNESLTACYYLPDGRPEAQLYAGSYCYQHAREHGFCFGCGEFWGGVESFEFAELNGNFDTYCDNCSEESRSELSLLDEDNDLCWSH